MRAGGTTSFAAVPGNDVIYGGPGNDVTWVGGGADVQSTGDGNDILHALANDNQPDILNCGPGFDVAYVVVHDPARFHGCEQIIRLTPEEAAAARRGERRQRLAGHRPRDAPARGACLPGLKLRRREGRRHRCERESRPGSRPRSRSSTGTTWLRSTSSPRLARSPT